MTNFASASVCISVLPPSTAHARHKLKSIHKKDTQQYFKLIFAGFAKQRGAAP